MIGTHIIRLSKIGSTNQYALSLLHEEVLPEGTVIVTGNQTEGRGVDNNKWESEPGKNLTFSMVIYPNYIPVEEQFYLNKAFSLGIFDLVRKEAGETTRIKWPNDVYIGDQKIAGILIQNGIRGNEFSYCVSGIGLNVNQEKFSSMPVDPVSLKMATGKKYNLNSLLEELSGALNRRLDQLRSGHLDLIDRDYHSALFRLNEWAGYLYHGKELKARILGVDSRGHLLLETEEGGRVKCDLKEIKFLV